MKKVAKSAAVKKAKASVPKVKPETKHDAVKAYKEKEKQKNIVKHALKKAAAHLAEKTVKAKAAKPTKTIVVEKPKVIGKHGLEKKSSIAKLAKDIKFKLASKPSLVKKEPKVIQKKRTVKMPTVKGPKTVKVEIP